MLYRILKKKHGWILVQQSLCTLCPFCNDYGVEQVAALFLS